MIAPILEKTDIHNPNIVKVVVNLSEDAIYYSREAIPSIKKNLNREQKYFMQLGINAFRKRSLKYFSSLDRIVSESVGVKKANTELGIAIFICYLFIFNKIIFL